MNVRCKMKVTEVSKTSYAHSQVPVDQLMVTLRPVSGSDNATWSKWTPGGECKLHISNPAAFDAFEIGTFFFVDFSSAASTEAGEVK